MKLINEDILTVEEGTIFHQVNCMGVMGAGLAKQIAEKYSEVLTVYEYMIRNAQPKPYELLGSYFGFPIHKDLQIVSIFGQYDYGRVGRYTEYAALNSAFSNIPYSRIQPPYCIPTRLGCGLGGGDWRIVSSIIEDSVPLENLVYYHL